MSILISAGLLLGLTACGGNTQTPNNGNNNAGTTAKKKQKTVYNMNETIQLGDHKLTVDKMTRSAGNEFDKPKSGNEYVIVHVIIQNGGKDQIDYNPLDFQIKNSQGNITDVAFSSVDQDTALQSGQLAPGGKVDGTLSFEAPKGDQNLQLVFTPSFWNNKKIMVNLK